MTGLAGNTVLVCGGRDFAAGEWLFREMDNLHAENPITLLIHGGARGADWLAGQWARKRSVPCRVFPADWKTHGTKAGPLRNQQMLEEGRPDLVVAFPGGRGTRDMLLRALRFDVNILEPKF